MLTLLRTGLEAAGLHPYGSQGTYFVLGDVRELGWEDGRAFCLGLPERCGVVAVPTVVFYDGFDKNGASEVTATTSVNLGALNNAANSIAYA